MGPAVGKGPAELARALFVVTSAGERGADALEIVEQAAKAAAIGLGDTAVTARAVTAAMQAYSSQGLTAQRATEILVATVREGNLRAEDLAGSLGRVIGIASQVGVTFEQVGGFIATFTRLGVSAQESTTALRQILTTILKPTSMSAAALRSVGLSSKMLRDEIGEKGLSGMLATLIDRFRGNEEMLAQVIPNVRALSGVMGTAGSQGEAFAEINRNIANSLNIVNEGFERVKRTPAQQWNEFKASAEVLAVTVGTKLIPIFQQVLATLKDASLWLSRLSPQTIDFAVSVGILAAALGPAALALSALIKLMAMFGGAGVLAAAGVAFKSLKTAVILAAGSFGEAGGAALAFKMALQDILIMKVPFVAALAAIAVGVALITVEYLKMREAQRRGAETQVEAYARAAESVKRLKAELAGYPDLLAKANKIAAGIMESGRATTSLEAMAIALQLVKREIPVVAGGMDDAADAATNLSYALRGVSTSDLTVLKTSALDTTATLTDGFIEANQAIVNFKAETVSTAIRVQLAALQMADAFGIAFADAVARGTTTAKAAFKSFIDYIIAQAARAAGSWAFKLIMFTLSGGNPFAAIAGLIQGFQTGGTAGFGRTRPSSADVYPAMLSKGERVVPAGQPAAAGATVGGGSVVLNIYPRAYTRAEAREHGYEIARVLKGLGYGG